VTGQRSLGSVDNKDENDSIVEEISFYTRDLNVMAAWFNIKFVTYIATVYLTLPPKCTALCPNLLLLLSTLIFNLFLASIVN